MTNIKLTAIPRIPAQKIKQLRESGYIPATIYGPKISPISIQIDLSQFQTLLKTLKPNQLIDLQIEDKIIKVLLHIQQKHPVSDTYLNLEFYAVDLAAKVTIEIPIHLTGEAPAVKILKGILFHNLHNLKVECLPSDIIPEIIVDVSSLDNFEKGIFVENLQIPTSLKVLNEKKELVVKVLPPKKEEEEEIAVATTEPVEPELVKEPKKEEVVETPPVRSSREVGTMVEKSIELQLSEYFPNWSKLDETDVKVMIAGVDKIVSDKGIVYKSGVITIPCDNKECVFPGTTIRAAFPDKVYHCPICGKTF